MNNKFHQFYEKQPQPKIPESPSLMMFFIVFTS